MCGIGGYISKSREYKGEAFLAACDESMCQRGPDQHGRLVEGNIGLVHRRLSIIDLSESGRQPMTDISGRLSITYNGEIYNYRELKVELLQKGCHFRSGSDTEVILQGYLIWGFKGLLERLEGMFAFAIYDRQEQILCFARDQFGKKPLYYYQDDTCFLFASDIRPIHKEVKQRLTLDLETIDYYLSELTSPQPHTIWKEIKQLPPAGYLVISLTDFGLIAGTYWKLPRNEPMAVSLEDAVQQTESLLTKAILKRTVADVPVGCFLSGGIDSGLVVSLLATYSSEKVRTFSVGFDGENNELPDARIVAERYQTDHHEIIITPSIIDDLPKLLQYVGEPFADSSLLPSYYVCKAMGGQLKVVLSGDGGDELFGGYSQYFLAYKTDRFLANHPAGWSAWLSAQADKLIARAKGKNENAGAYLHYARLSGAERLFRQMGFTEAEKQNLYKADAKPKVPSFFSSWSNHCWEENQSNSLTSTIMEASLHTRLLNDYLVKVDRASMINSLEVRSPFLDKELAAFAFSLPDEWKFSGAIPKYILKKLASRYFDPAVFTKPKRGFGFPLEKWLHKDFQRRLQELTDPGAPLYKMGLFDQKTVGHFVDQFYHGTPGLGHRIWALLCMDEWSKLFYV